MKGGPRPLQKSRGARAHLEGRPPCPLPKAALMASVLAGGILSIVNVISVACLAQTFQCMSELSLTVHLQLLYRAWSK